jgi:molybdopterin synthase sulfur carrier subunit
LNADVFHTIGTITAIEVSHIMAKIQVQFLSALVIFTKERKVEVDVPSGSNITTLMGLLHQKYGQEAGAKVFKSDGSMSHVLIILVNGTDIRHLDGMDTELQGGDVVVVMPIIAGG